MERSEIVCGIFKFRNEPIYIESTFGAFDSIRSENFTRALNLFPISVHCSPQSSKTRIQPTVLSFDYLCPCVSIVRNTSLQIVRHISSNFSFPAVTRPRIFMHRRENFECKNTRHVGNVEKYTNYYLFWYLSNETTICPSRFHFFFFFLNDVPKTMNLFDNYYRISQSLNKKKYITVTVKRQTP